MSENKSPSSNAKLLKTYKNGTPSKKPLIISSKKWNNVLKSLNKGDKIENNSKEEKTPKKDSRTDEQKPTEAIIEEEKLKATEKALKNEQEYKELLEAEEKIRQEKIKKAKTLILQLKPGPRELDSAAICSEVIKGREIQKSIKAEFEKTLKENEKKEDEKNQLQYEKWLMEDHNEKKEKSQKYRTELLQQIQAKQQFKVDFIKNLQEYEKQLKDQQEKEMKEQIEREKSILERKREAMRKCALEAMKMMEQRRLREKTEEAIESEIAEIYKESKENIEKIKKEKEKEEQEEKIKRVEENSKRMLMDKSKNEEDEEERRRKFTEEFHAKLDAQERERIEKARKRKAERIKAYLEQMEKQKLAKTKTEEKLKWDMACRLKNEEVDQEFYKAQIKAKEEKAIRIRTILEEQIREKKLHELEEKEKDKLCNDQTSKEEDKYFMDYADKLVKHANKKERKIWPIVRAVEQYKKNNFIGIERYTPRHLKSNIPIKKLVCKCQPTIKPVIKYDKDELKQLNPYILRTKPILWA